MNTSGKNISERSVCLSFMTCILITDSHIVRKEVVKAQCILKISMYFINYRYPQALHFLELLQYEHFRKELVNAQCAKFIDDQQLLHWQHYQRKRMQLLTAEAEEQSQKQKDKENKPS